MLKLGGIESKTNAYGPVADPGGFLGFRGTPLSVQVLKLYASMFARCVHMHPPPI